MPHNKGWKKEGMGQRDKERDRAEMGLCVCVCACVGGGSEAWVEWGKRVVCEGMGVGGWVRGTRQCVHACALCAMSTEVCACMGGAYLGPDTHA